MANQAAGDGRVCRMAEGLVGSEILKIAGEIRASVAAGAEVCNLTVGDFSPAEFRIPAFLEDAVCEALRAGETSYPPSEGMGALRAAVSDFDRRRLGLEHGPERVLVTGGSRPGIYVAYRALVDPGDRVVYPVPSWNNNHYSHLVGAEGVPVVCRPEDAFLPTRDALEPVLRGARLLALNSPLNPTGTAFTAAALEEVCDLVLEENRRRGPGERPLYVMYDQVYWMLTFPPTEHVHPVALRPEMEPYTVYVDGISKAFAATGVRVGWTVAPPDITARMASILGHLGAWAPRAEQVATARLLAEDDVIDAYHATLKEGVRARLDALHAGLARLREAGFPVDAMVPMGAIYLSARFDLHGRAAPGGGVLRTSDDVRHYLLEAAGLAVVPFQAFGMRGDTGWFRLSAGAVSLPEVEAMFGRLRRALEALGEAPAGR
ncbi:MAG TPA: aminotransferase class I/II-fold pyridoxal phosphate-dependent enzyme [Longimicrobiaceae bacterium]|nr:aminotransferase class I/II-fold pyridoxal phosphate-dependent enzyme [Longimicrobiaceae bacterium]